MEQSPKGMKDGVMLTAFGAQGWYVGEGQRSLASQERAVSNPICPQPDRPDYSPPLEAGATCCPAGELQPGWPGLGTVIEPRDACSLRAPKNQSQTQFHASAPLGKYGLCISSWVPCNSPQLLSDLCGDHGPFFE